MSLQDVFSEIISWGYGMHHSSGVEAMSDAQSGECQRIISMLILLASDMLGAGLRSALRSFIRPRIPLVELSAGVEENFRRLEQQQKRSRNPTTCPLAAKDSPEDPRNAPFAAEVRGLKNRGQTCYANSVVQALASLPPLCAYLESMQGKGPRNGGDRSISPALYRTLRYVNGHRAAGDRTTGSSSLPFGWLFSPCSPGDSELMSVLGIVAGRHPQFRSRTGMAGTQEQQDAHEFFSSLMDVLSSEESPGSARGATDAIAANYANEGTEEEEKKHEDYSVHHDRNDPLSRGPIQSDKNHRTKTKPENLLVGTHVTKDVNAPGLDARNPFDGWSGSTIKCASCRHIRPIRSAPFLSLSLPIAGVRSQFLADFLAAEYGGFAAAETVSDVRCLSCAIRTRVRECEEEENILAGAITSVRRRSGGKTRRNNGGTAGDLEGDVAGLLQERRQVKRRIAILESLDPDADDYEFHCGDEANAQPEIEWGIGDSLPPIVPLRGDAYKASLILRPPEVLCVHIQRRHFDMASQRMTKVAHRVQFTERLDIGPYCAYGGNSFERRDDSRGNTAARIPYVLMSVIEHRGNAFGGHYQAFRRVDTRRNEWILVSDENVTRKTWSDVRDCQAYMLFYVAASPKI